MVVLGAGVPPAFKAAVWVPTAHAKLDIAVGKSEVFDIETNTDFTEKWSPDGAPKGSQNVYFGGPL